MAQLLKERSRKPIVESAFAFPATKFINNELHYAIEIGEMWKPGGKHIRYAAALTKTEAMAIMCKWLEIMAQQETSDRREKSQ